ncbi:MULTISPECIES: tripartite tricarboxylate transporter permease [Aliiglaciecola]|uniref:tripartite tricarboxylate transporter permease n=1 Tax=Aliiglaciecola TaxID=1406885 RepID=UPI001C08D1F5|nr:MULTISPECIES: tripartite tricarboxylate transporter permease [Aliiglaciecola]MBU2879905.1 tripartite tricarboxylate transporter permease [Aliiglaciecola lipolytica]MDO6712411.1 tripartite tricarboxylate transporter permease [Aliiglaciecola sp. 2_MG-2023]MDO6753405.1 tripartite tricarboxylate transporter permease [Aliiglaciecola sp. 1_MG-2023]
MIDQFLQFFSILFNLVSQPSNLLILFASSFIGILFGAMPGLTATLGIALLTTLTYSLNTDTALISLLGMYVGAVYGGSYPAILLNIPGTPAAAATALDGYPMAKRGEGAKALGLTTTASLIGTLIGLVFLVVLSPAIATVALQFTSWEFFLLALFGIIISGSITSQDLVIKGWITGFLGLLLSTIGRDSLQYFPRYTFEQSQLDSGLEIVPVLIGVFGIPQVIRVLSDRDTLGKPSKLSRVLPELAAIKRNIKHIFRSAGVGVGIGSVPGIGEDIAGWVSYSAAKKTSTPEEQKKFGHGSEAAIVSSETANNACVGGALIPLLTLGIPGSPPAAMLLGALLLHGITPGPTIEIDHPNFLLEVTAILVLASLAMWANGMLLAKQVLKLLQVPPPLFIPVVGALCVLGAYSLGINIFNLYIMLPVGICAYFLSEMKFPLAPLVIGLVLGSMADESLRRALMLSEGSFWPLFERPVAVILLLIIVSFCIIQIPLIRRGGNAFMNRFFRRTARQ